MSWIGAGFGGFAQARGLDRFLGRVCAAREEGKFVVSLRCTPAVGRAEEFLRAGLWQGRRPCLSGFRRSSREQYSRIENGAVLTASNDKLVRLMVIAMSVIGALKEPALR